MQVIYLAGGLFNAGERLHNLFLEQHLKLLGYTVILPQREALKFASSDGFDINAVAADCRRNSENPNSLLVGNSDGADADSGTAAEIGIAMTATGKAIVYRTDFRTDMKNELGVNAMLRMRGTSFVYCPCLFTELSEVENYYRQLALNIHHAIRAVEADTGYYEPLKPQKNA